MALNNPAFNTPAFQDPRAVQTYPGGAQAARFGGSAPQYAPPPAVAAQLEGQFAAPSAGARETDRMTVEDTVFKTLGLFAVLLAGAAVGWVWTLGGLSALAPNQLSLLPMVIGGLVGFVLSLVVIFTSRKTVRPALIMAYAAFEGLFIGGISAFFEVQWEGIVLQATLATVSVVGVTLALFASGRVRASRKATKIFLIAMVGYAVFGIINLLLMMFNAPIAGGAFGLYSQEFMGIPLGVIIGVFVVIMAAYSLVLDFDQIQQGVRNGAPRKFGWMGAFGIMVTVVWLYVEILRMIAIIRGSD